MLFCRIQCEILDPLEIQRDGQVLEQLETVENFSRILIIQTISESAGSSRSLSPVSVTFLI